MKRWAFRHTGFRVGFIGVVLCSVFFVIGFISPSWKSASGLWMSCSHSYKMCASYSSNIGHLPAWFDAVRAFECLGFLAVILCIASEVYMDFLSQPSPDRRLVELFALTAGTCGLIGAITFAIFTPISDTHEEYLSWGFALTTASSCFLVAFASFIAYFRQRGLDLTRYTASSSVHYQASDGIVIPAAFSGVDLAPPPYSEVMASSLTPMGSQGVRGSSHFPPSLSQNTYYKPAGTPDSQLPPAYFPPPSGGQFQAPPPYSVVAGSSGQVSLPPSSEQNFEEAHLPNSGVDFVNEGAIVVGYGLSSDASASNHPEPTTGSFEVDANAGRNSLMSSVPVYYVTVLGQPVPVFLEELQQAGQEVPSSAAGPVPAYFIMTHGQHVPVYSEEQARALNN